MDRETALRDLRQGTPEGQTRAARILGRWSDDQVLAALVETLHSPHRGIREAAIDTLIEIGDSRAVRLLVPVLHSSVPAVRNAARLLLQRLSKAAPELLTELAGDSDVRMRIFAADIMSESGDHEFAAPLLRLLEDPHENVSSAAIAGLGRLGASEAVPALEKLASEGSPWMRFGAIDSLAQIPTPEAQRALVRLLDRVPADFGEAVVESIARHGSPEAIAPLVRTLAERPGLRSAIVGALIGPFSSHVIRRLVDRDRAFVAQAVGQALSEDGARPERVIEGLALLADLGCDVAAPILRHLSSQDSGVRDAAVGAALRLRIPDATPALERLLPSCPESLAARIRAALPGMIAGRKETL